MHATLLGTLTMAGVHRVACLEGRHNLALARDDPEEHVGAHGGCEHRTHQQESSLARENVASQVGSNTHQHQNHGTDGGVAIFLLTESAADEVIQQPEHHQEAQRRSNGSRRAHGIGVARSDQIDVGVPQIGNRQQRKAGQPGGVAFPVEPVQVVRHLGRRHVELDGMVETATVHSPKLAADALLFQVVVNGRRQAAVQEHEVER